MKTIICQTLKHTGMWSTLPQAQVSAFAGNNVQPSIRGSEYNYRDGGYRQAYACSRRREILAKGYLGLRCL